jgi:hypothetical protein
MWVGCKLDCGAPEPRGLVDLPEAMCDYIGCAKLSSRGSYEASWYRVLMVLIGSDVTGWGIGRWPGSGGAQRLGLGEYPRVPR